MFVDITNGTNGATGTKEDPVDDIAEGMGIAIADAVGKDVCVAAGTPVAFMESSDGDEPTSFINNEFGPGFTANYQDFSGGVTTPLLDIAVINALDEDGRNPVGTVYGNY